MVVGLIVAIVLVVVLVLVLTTSIRIVRQATGVVVERLGKYSKTLDTGVHFILPLFDNDVWGLFQCFCHQFVA